MLAEVLTGKAAPIRSPVTLALKKDIRVQLLEMKPIKATARPTNWELSQLVEVILSEADWAWGQTQALKLNLQRADRIAEYQQIQKSLINSIECLQHMSWDVSFSLGYDFEELDLRDEAQALVRQFEDAIKRIESAMRPVGAKAGMHAKPKSDSQRNLIATELAKRTISAISNLNLKVTASGTSPTVQILKIVGDKVGLARSLPTWRDTVHRISKTELLPGNRTVT